MALSAIGSLSAQGVRPAGDVIIRLRLAGDSTVLAPLRSCLADKIAQMPDTKVAVVPTDGARFIVDIVATKEASEGISASLVVVQTFPLEVFRPRIKEGEDATALLNSIRYYTLLRAHEVIAAQPIDTLCQRIVSDMKDKVLTQEYVERND